MDFSSMFSALNGGVWVDDVLFWTVAALTGVVGLIAVVNALDMFYEAEAG